MAGMTRRQAKKAEKRQKQIAGYGEYLSAMKRSQRHAKSMTQYQWRKATPRTKQVALQKARS